MSPPDFKANRGWTSPGWSCQARVAGAAGFLLRFALKCGAFAGLDSASRRLPDGLPAWELLSFCPLPGAFQRSGGFFSASCAWALAPAPCANFQSVRPTSAERAVQGDDKQVAQQMPGLTLLTRVWQLRELLGELPQLGMIGVGHPAHRQPSHTGYNPCNAPL